MLVRANKSYLEKTFKESIHSHVQNLDSQYRTSQQNP